MLDEVRTDIRGGTFDACGQAPQEVSPMVFRELADIYKARDAGAKKLSLARTIDLAHPTDHRADGQHDRGDDRVTGGGQSVRTNRCDSRSSRRFRSPLPSRSSTPGGCVIDNEVRLRPLRGSRRCSSMRWTEMPLRKRTARAGLEVSLEAPRCCFVWELQAH